MDGTRQMRGQHWPDNGGTGESCDCAERVVRRFSITNNLARCTLRKNEIQSGYLFQIILPDRITPLPLQMIDQCDQPRPIYLPFPLDLAPPALDIFNLHTIMLHPQSQL